MINNALNTNNKLSNTASEVINEPNSVHAEVPIQDAATVAVQQADSVQAELVEGPPPDWSQRYPKLKAILDFLQPILIELVHKSTVQLKLTKTRDSISCDFAFREDPGLE